MYGCTRHRDAHYTYEPKPQPWRLEPPSCGLKPWPFSVSSRIVDDQLSKKILIHDLTWRSGIQAPTSSFSLRPAWQYPYWVKETFIKTGNSTCLQCNMKALDPGVVVKFFDYSSEPQTFIGSWVPLRFQMSMCIVAIIPSRITILFLCFWPSDLPCPPRRLALILWGGGGASGVRCIWIIRHITMEIRQLIVAHPLRGLVPVPSS